MLKKNTIDFEVDKNIIVSVIKSQAGSPSKAFLELVMNSIDANATEINITFDTKTFTVYDNGKGFKNEEEIHKYFKTFGTPHQEGDAIYGKFRMGRGQIMAFSKNTWRTNTFQMEVDIEKNGVNFEFTKDLPFQEGVLITGTFYEPLSYSDYNDLVKELKEFVIYSQIKTIVNGVVFNKILKEEKWTIETEEAYIKIKTSNNDIDVLKIYNLGVLVCKYPSTKFGVGGVIVSKKQLEVNFARNDILISKCKIWKKISKDMKEIGLERSEKKINFNKNLEECEITNLTNNFINNGDLWNKLEKYPIFTDIVGKNFTISKFLTFKSFTISINNKTIDEKIYKDKNILVLNNKVFSRFDVSNTLEFKEKLIKILKEHKPLTTEYIRKLENIIPIEIEKLRKNFKEEHKTINDKDLSKRSLARIKALRNNQHYIIELINATKTSLNHKLKLRTLNVGNSDVADAWTDGLTYICINNKKLEHIDKGIGGLLYLAELLVHEYLHDNSNNLHDIEFYKNFHNVMSREPKSITYVQKESHIIRFMKKVNKSYIKELNLIEALIPEKVLKLDNITNEDD